MQNKIPNLVSNNPCAEYLYFILLFAYRIRLIRSM